MEIKHHINIHSDERELYEYVLQSSLPFVSTTFPNSEKKLISLDLSESHPSWVGMLELLRQYNQFEPYKGGDQYNTYFSEGEIRNAEWATIHAQFQQGYPQPENNWPFKQDSPFALVNVCPKCAIYEQVHPIRLKKEPRMGKNSFMNIFWFYEYFVTHPVIHEFKAKGAKGFEDWDVYISKDRKIAESVRQLFIPGKTSPGLLEVDDLGRKVCPVCGTVKYLSHLKGTLKYKRSSVNPDTDFLRTAEWFGSAHTSYNEILVSNRIANLILDKGWKGVRLKVVELI